MSSRSVYRMCAQVAPSGECLRGKGPPDWMLAKPWCSLFLAAYTLWSKTGCCCFPAIERSVLTIIKRRLLLLFFIAKYSINFILT